MKKKPKYEKKIYFFIGTTAELIKLSPVIKEFNRRKIAFDVITSGQSAILFDEFRSMGPMRVIYECPPKSHESSVSKFIFWAFRSFFSFLSASGSLFDGSNSVFIVHGDTVSSLIGAIVARIRGLTLVHIESGYRSFNFLEPFPEEMCRYLVSRLADIHFCPNAWCKANLKTTKGVKIDTVENTLIENFWNVMKKKSQYVLPTSKENRRKPYFVVVVHRQEHVIFGMQKTIAALKFVLAKTPKNLTCVLMVHDVSTRMADALMSVIPKTTAKKITRISRLPYIDFMHVIAQSEFLVTDGGSNQQEMYYMGKPCLLLRNYTEQIEGIGKNVVLGQSNHKRIAQFLSDYKTYKRKPVTVGVWPSKIIADYLTGRQSV
jgi:UDP-N-acetylglucosamine 2-epimerase (non-hydrolysing)